MNSCFILIYENMLGRLSQFKPIVKNRWLMNIFYPLGFLLLSTLLEALYLNISENTLRDVYLDHVATISAQVINFITPSDKVFIHQNSLLSGKAYLEVARTCSGSSVLFFLVAAILVFSASVRHKIVGLVLALLLVVVINLLRIIGLYFAMVYQPDWFLPIHIYISPTLTIILCCLFFAWWALPAKETPGD
ncbi:MAG: exosortase family protein XrtM [Methylococcaceae bacterium]|nr:exosortase family protein XrtM [Methylococcaceae bacterium]MDP3934012.1 exosortase family protein XrtM [Methylococcaceae bacterium]